MDCLSLKLTVKVNVSISIAENFNNSYVTIISCRNDVDVLKSHRYFRYELISVVDTVISKTFIDIPVNCILKFSRACSLSIQCYCLFKFI